MTHFRLINAARAGGLLTVLFILALALLVPAQEAAAERNQAYVLTVDDAIGPATRDHITRNITRAERESSTIRARLPVVMPNTLRRTARRPS